MRHLKTKRHPQGVVAIEAALVLPVLVAVILGGLQYGWLFLKQQEITNVVRHAVRYATLPDVGFSDAKTMINTRLGLLGIDSGAVIESTVAWVDSTANDVGDALYAQVSIDAEAVDIINFFPAPDKLTAHATMSKEGP